MRNSNFLLVPMLILGLSLMLSTFIFVSFWSRRYKENQTITVTGSAKREITSDLGILRVWVQATGATADVAKIKRISLDITSLVNQGISFAVNPPEYYYTKLADLKIEIQADAAKDALNRAQKIAEATGSTLGPISNARMGVLQITPVNSNMVSDYGINDVSSIEKEITAVVNASFRLD